MLSEDAFGHLNYVQDADPEYRRLKEQFEKQKRKLEAKNRQPSQE